VERSIALYFPRVRAIRTWTLYKNIGEMKMTIARESARF
jgi:hypothetical protein